MDEAKSKQIGFAKCPFDLTTMKVNDGRNAAMANSALCTVFGVVDGKARPVRSGIPPRTRIDHTT